MTQPLCFVLMPFGKKPDGAGGTIDFDAVYRELIAPAVIAAELDVVRADEELTGGIIHKPMFERLLLCEYAVADLTTANANVFYELGVRHALRPFSTVLVFSEGMRLPFDVASLRALPYALEPSGVPADPQRHGAALTERLREARARATDSPLFHLIDGLPVPEIDRAKTDVFQQQVRAASKLKERLADARDGDLATIVAVRDELGAIADAEAELVVALFLAYRDCGAYEEMVTLVDEMSPPLAKTAMVQEQLALALNRLGDGERAERVLLDLLTRRGASSETYGLLGRVYKDRWTAAKAAGRAARAAGLLQAAIDAYVKGFETDWRDAYPGVNAVSLIEIRDPADPRLAELLPVVEYAARRRVAAGAPDYWDYATLLELAVVRRDEAAVVDALGRALAAAPPDWKPASTLNNLRLIREARAERRDPFPAADDAERELAGELVAP